MKSLEKIEKIFNIKTIRNKFKEITKLYQTLYLKMVLERKDMKYNKHQSTELSNNQYSSFYILELTNQRIDLKQY